MCSADYIPSHRDIIFPTSQWWVLALAAGPPAGTGIIKWVMSHGLVGVPLAVGRLVESTEDWSFNGAGRWRTTVDKHTAANGDCHEYVETAGRSTSQALVGGDVWTGRSTTVVMSDRVRVQPVKRLAGGLVGDYGDWRGLVRGLVGSTVGAYVGGMVGSAVGQLVGGLSADTSDRCRSTRGVLLVVIGRLVSQSIDGVLVGGDKETGQSSGRRDWVSSTLGVGVGGMVGGDVRQLVGRPSAATSRVCVGVPGREFWSV
jgi:hypothetical protein